MAVQPGLCRTWSKTPKTGFLTTRIIFQIEECRNKKNQMKRVIFPISALALIVDKESPSFVSSGDREIPTRGPTVPVGKQGFIWPVFRRACWSLFFYLTHGHGLRCFISYRLKITNKIRFVEFCLERVYLYCSKIL